MRVQLRSPFGIDRTAVVRHSRLVSSPESVEAGVDALREAAAHVGLQVELHDAHHSDRGIDLVLVSPRGERHAVVLKQLSLVPLDGLARRLKEWNAHLTTPGTIGVVVADRITRDARRSLQEAGWGWLDLRGHIHLAAPGIFIDANLPPLKVLPVDLPIPPLPVGIMTLKNRTLSPVTRLFIDCTRELTKPLARQSRPRR